MDFNNIYHEFGDSLSASNSARYARGTGSHDLYVYHVILPEAVSCSSKGREHGLTAQHASLVQRR